MNTHTLLYFSFILQTFIFKNGNVLVNTESLKMNEKINNVWMFIRSLSMKMNIWKWTEMYDNESLELRALNLGSGDLA